MSTLWNKPKLIAVLLAAVTAITVGGYAVASADSETGNGQAASPGEPELRAIPVVTSAKDIRLPYMAYYETPRQEKLELEVGYAYGAQCARRFGVERTDPPSNAPLGLERDAARRYGIVGKDDIDRVGGYAAPPPDPRTVINDKFTNPWNPSDKELLILDGVHQFQEQTGKRVSKTPVDAQGSPLPENGCAGWGYSVAQPPGSQAAISTRHDLQNAGSDSEKDSRVKKVFADWSACMKAAGYTYTGPWDANNSDVAVKANSESKRLAEADVDCRLKTNLVGVWVAVETAKEREYIASHPEQIAQLQAWLNSYMKNVKKAATTLL